MRSPVNISSSILLILTALVTLVSCEPTRRVKEDVAPSRGKPKEFAEIVQFLEKHADAIVLSGEGDSRILISPQLQGRLMTLKVGAVASTGYVNYAAIQAGEVNEQFNNFGGADRFWIGPEAGQFGIYFPPGAELNRDTWVVPRALNTGAFEVKRRDSESVLLGRDMEFKSYTGREFEVHVEREIGILRAEDLSTELGVNLPAGVSYCGAYTLNRMTNDGETRWLPDTGLVGIWILGMFAASDSSIVIAPFRPGDESELGAAFHDNYFGRVTWETPERLKVVDNVVLFRGDARRVGKFGIPQKRTTGLAGSYDFEKKLLTIVRFDVPTEPSRYGNSTWVKEQEEPYAGDLFQSYNSGDAERPGEVAEADFYELESTSPSLPLGPGETVSHRHVTHHFQGSEEALAQIAKRVLGVDLETARKTMLPSR